MLQNNDWFGETLKKEDIKNFIKKYFTICWLRFFKMQIPFLIRHRNVFEDLETWIVWGNIALSHQYHSWVKAKLIKEQVDFHNYYSQVLSVKNVTRINASSISDISTIPRATVIRKLKWLVKQGIIFKTKELVYIMMPKGKMNKKIDENFLINQNHVAEFLTDIFDLMKNSNFKI